MTTVGSVLIPIANFIIPPKVEEATQHSLVAGKMCDLQLNAGKFFRFGSKSGIGTVPENKKY